MKLEVLSNDLQGAWWISIGLSLEHTPNYPGKERMCVSIELLIFTIYIRW